MGRARYFTVKAGGQYLANSVIHNQALSFDALGLLLVMLAMHPAQPKTRDTLTGRGLGRRAVAVALHNLEAEGFRYRFKYAGVDGSWRSVCVLFDEPHDFASAFEVVQQLVDVPVACWRDAQDRPLPVDNSGVGDKTPGRTEVPVPVPRCVEGVSDQVMPVDNSGKDDVKPQVTGYLPRSHRGTGDRPSVGGTSYISKDIYSNKSKDLSFNPNRTGSVTSSLDARETENPVRLGVDLVGGGVTPAASTPTTSLSGEHSPDDDCCELDGLVDGFVEAAVPEMFWSVLDSSGRSAVRRLLVQAQRGGWDPRDIYARLNATGPIGEAQRPAAVVIYRLRRVVAGSRPVSVVDTHRTQAEMIDQARADLEAIIGGASTLPHREQVLRVNGYANSGVLQSALAGLIEKAETVLQTASECGAPPGPDARVLVGAG